MQVAISFLSSVDRLTAKIGPLNTVIDAVVERLAPKAEAAACGTPYYCGSSQGAYCHYGCVGSLAYRYWDEKKYYRFNGAGACYHLCTDPCDYYLRWPEGDIYC